LDTAAGVDDGVRLGDISGSPEIPAAQPYKRLCQLRRWDLNILTMAVYINNNIM
jgi:hypothetical protein